MGRPKQWPPRPHAHKSGRDRVRIDGVDYWMGKTGSAEAKTAYACLLARLASGQTPVAPKAEDGLTVQSVVVLWLAEELPRHKGNEAYQFKRTLKVVLRLFGSSRAEDFAVAELETVQKAMLSGSWMTPQEAEKAKASRKTIQWCRNYTNRQVVRIRTVWRWLERRRLVPEGRWANLTTLPGIAAHDASARQTPDVRAATREELDAVLPHCLPAVRAMLLLLWHTGMRPAEARLMTPGQIDRSGEVWVYRPARHKMSWRGQTRQVTLGPRAQEVLAPFLAGLPPEAWVFAPSSRRKHTHYSADAFVRAVNRATEQAGQPGFTSYQLRHAFRLRVGREAGLEGARAAMGHRSIETTADYAAGVDLSLAADVAKRLG